MLQQDEGFFIKACFYNTVFFLVHDGWRTKDELSIVLQLYPEYAITVDSIPRLQKVDFSSLSEPCLEYEDQEDIDHHQVIMLSACLIHYDWDFGGIIRYCNHEIVGKYHD